MRDLRLKNHPQIVEIVCGSIASRVEDMESVEKDGEHSDFSTKGSTGKSE